MSTMISSSFQRNIVTVLMGAILASIPLAVGPSGFTPSSIHAQDTAQPQASAAAAQKTTITGCNWYTAVTDPGTCAYTVFVSWLGSWILTIGAGLLLFAGYFFDNALQYLVIDFQKTITDLNLFGGIQIAWQLFRDIANIAIIGVFVSVAIMTILGSAEYGAKRLISRVLIVAILINFSLLFTRIVIESTNFVSGQFARSMPGRVENQNISTAETFLTAFGITDWWNTEDVARAAAEQAGNSSAGFFYGLVGGSVMVFISYVLLYGAWVISVRSILLIVALITSSLAFASFLLPQTAAHQYIGWNQWWSNLLKAAIFGPLLMVFLWITMQIIGRAQVSGAGAALSALSANPAQVSVNQWQQIIFLMIGTGMLFFAIRSAGSFSSSISGYNLWSGGLRSALSGPLGLAAGGIGLAGRNTFGRTSYLAAKLLAEGAKNDNKSPRTRSLYDFSSQKFMKASQKEFNPLRTSLGSRALNLSGIKKDTVLGKATGGFKAAEDQRNKSRAEKAARMEPSAADQTKKTGEAIASAIRDNPELGLKHATSKQAVSDSENDVKRLISEQQSAVNEFNKNIKSLSGNLEQVQLRVAGGDPTARNEADRLKLEIETQRSDHQAALSEQSHRIRSAKIETENARSMHAEVINELAQVAKNTGKLPEKFDSATEIGEKLVRKSLTGLIKETAGLKKVNDIRVEEMTKLITKQGKTESIRDAFSEYMKDISPKDIPPAANDNQKPPHTAAA